MTTELRIEGFTAITPVGSGGLGDVYCATRASTGGTVALKVLRDLGDVVTAWRRTNRELAALVDLKGHPNVVSVEEVLDTERGPVLVMEYAPRGSVAGFIGTRDRGLHPSEVVLIGLHTASALTAAHRHEIVHRDIKPQNLLISGFGHVKVCDFGIASLARSEDFRSRTSALSFQYASPEELDDEPDVGPPTDVYSLGATLLHALTGRPPKQKKQEQLAFDTLPSFGRDYKQIVAALCVAIGACIEEAHADRPTSPELVKHLRAIEQQFVEPIEGLADTIPNVTLAHTTSAQVQPVPIRGALIQGARPSNDPAILPLPIAGAAPSDWWTS